MPTKPTFREALLFWFKLGCISFGGPVGQIAIMHEYIVIKRKWLSESKFLHALNYCMLLPGPEAQQLTIYIGWLLHGVRGGIVAGTLFVLPSMFLLLLLSVLYVSYSHLPLISAAFILLKPAVLAIVLLALLKIGKKSLLSWLHYSIAALSFLSIFVFHLPFPLLILSTILIAFLIEKTAPHLLQAAASHTTSKIDNEDDYFINKNTLIPNTGFSSIRFIKQISIAILLWILPIILLFWLSADFIFWKNLIFFFTKAAFVTFGGAYAVLPYIAQVSVQEFHWLTELQMIDGLALGETTPGPLIIVLSFVGFMAGYNHFGSSLLMGSLGLCITTFFSFLPSFFFILIGAPIIEKTQNNLLIKKVLGLVSATIVGVILNLTIYLNMAVLWQNKTLHLPSFVWLIASLLALSYYKINMIVWIIISAVMGMIWYVL